MKIFLLHGVKLLIILNISALVLGFLFIKIHDSFKKINKKQAIINAKFKTYDVIMLSFSMTNNHFEPKIFQEKIIKYLILNQRFKFTEVSIITSKIRNDLFTNSKL